jgi:hypothetical protein
MADVSPEDEGGIGVEIGPWQPLLERAHGLLYTAELRGDV